jgi:hypothetical protein
MPLDPPFEADDSQPWWQFGPPLRITVHPAAPPNPQPGIRAASERVNDGHPDDWVMPDGYPDDWVMSDGYPDDWIAPAPSTAQTQAVPSAQPATTNPSISNQSRPADYAAHHIAAGADPRAEVARGILKKFGICINDAVNGVFLPANRATQVIAGETIHSTLHTKEYYDAVNEALEKATTKQEAIDILRNIGRALQAGDYP